MTITETRTLATGQRARLEMPDMLALVGGGIDIPNSALADVVELVFGDAFALTEEEQLASNRKRIKGLYEIAALCLVEPRLVLRGTPKAGEIGSRDLSWGDVLGINAWFRA